MMRIVASAVVALLALSPLSGSALLPTSSAALASAAVTDPVASASVASTAVTDPVAPIVVLLDVSGSMRDEDGSGVVKLDGAKTAVRDVIDALAPATTFGIWAFPSNGCDGGEYLSEPMPLSEKSAVIGSLNAANADGDTPTGVALRDVADDLSSRGYESATIVLVSDGESSCGPPPCDVAGELIADGFDVTIPTVGFRTSKDGAEELACIAAATGAKTFAVDDSAGLADQLDELVRARLVLSTRFDRSPMSGGATKITAIVTNDAAVAAADVRLGLGFVDAGAADRPRAAVPPVVRLGNIPSGETLEYTWTVGTGPRDRRMTTTFTLSAWSTNAIKQQVVETYTVRPPTYARHELGEVFAGVTNKTPLVVFGDSYSSGEGTGPGGYYQTPVGVSADCHRSPKTYLGTVFSRAQLVVLACSGATTSALLSASPRSSMSQVQEMNSLGLTPGAAIMTFGGNDIDFAGTVALCIDPRQLISAGCAEQKFFEDKLADARGLVPALTKTYETAWAAINTPDLRARRDGAYAPVLVLPYPKITHQPSRGACHQFSAAEVIAAEQLTTTLNDAIEAAAGRARDAGYEVHFVDDVEEAVRPDHTLCQLGPVAYVNGWVVSPADWPPFEPESVHPKTSGYLAISDAIARWSRSAEREAAQVSDAEAGRLLETVAPPIEITWPTRVDLSAGPDDLLLFPGSGVQPQVDGYLPGSTVAVRLHSTPVLLGNLEVDEAGGVDGVLLLPPEISLGRHTLVISGFRADGVYDTVSVPVSVIAPTPPWVWVASIGAAASTVAGLLLLCGRRRRLSANS